MSRILACIIVILFVVNSTQAMNTEILGADTSSIKKNPLKKLEEDSLSKTQWIIYEQAPSPAKTTNVADTIPQKNNVDKKQKRHKKIIATLLSFPVPFGIVGLHRIYLGTKPYVPLVYIATFGGAAGIVPLIDFVFLLVEKDISKYENNPTIIMWAN